MQTGSVSDSPQLSYRPSREAVAQARASAHQMTREAVSQVARELVDQNIDRSQTMANWGRISLTLGSRVDIYA